MSKMKIFNNKIVLIISLSIFLSLIATWKIQDIVNERSTFRDEAQADIKSKWSGSQRLGMVAIGVPYETTVTEYNYNTQKDVTRKVMHVAYILPQKVDIQSQVKTEERYRGIYKFPVYTADVDGEFDFKADISILPTANRLYFPSRAFVQIGFDDIKGVYDFKMKWNGVETTAEPSETNMLNSLEAVHMKLPADFFEHVTTHKLSLTTKIRGMNSFEFAALGKTNSFETTSSWKHPSFTGLSLPSTREVSDKGFHATWNIQYQLSACPRTISTQSTDISCFAEAAGTSFYQPVTTYTLTTRAIKYSLLIIGLTFIAFFLMELISGTNIHFMRYSLVGFAMILFYILLVALAEHLGFTAGYIIASIAVVALSTLYSKNFLQKPSEVKSFFGLMVGLYGFLYLLLSEEEYALLFGSVGLFAILAGIMWLTRKVKWEDFGKNNLNAVGEKLRSE